eukprot:5021621-Pyramimonas_sp.AAC.1
MLSPLVRLANKGAPDCLVDVELRGTELPRNRPRPRNVRRIAAKVGGESNSSVVKRLIKGLTGGELNSSVVKRLTKGFTGGELNSSVVKRLIKGLMGGELNSSV